MSMQTFRYSAYRATGSLTSGTIEAETAMEAGARLKKDGLHPREIVPLGESPRSAFRLFRGCAGLADTALMTRRLATLVGSSVPVFEAISTLHEQERPGDLRLALGRIRGRLAEGATLAKAMAVEPALFGESYTSMVAAGEESGALEVILGRLADFLERQQEVRSQVVTACAYPLLMTVVGSAVMLFLLAFVVPKITLMFEQNGAALPLITLLLIAVSSMLSRFWWLLLVLAVAAVFGYRKAMAREAARSKRDSFLLRLPLIGNLLRGLVLARFARGLGLLLESGVPIVRALEITGEMVVNRKYRKFLRAVREDLVGGASLSSTLGGSDLFPQLLVHMVATGEKSGNLETMLVRAGAAYEREFSAAITRSMAILEPFLVLAMGLAVGFVVLAVLLPIFQLNQLIR